jgi:hypothetical protein
MATIISSPILVAIIAATKTGCEWLLYEEQ